MRQVKGVNSRGKNSLIAKKRIIIIKTNLVERDPRLGKEIDTLKREGYAVTLLCWDRERKEVGPQQRNIESNYDEIRFRFKAPYGMVILLFLPIWWCFEFYQLLKTRWDISNAINFDSVVPAIIAARFKNMPIIYEIYDVYADMLVLPRSLRYIAIKIDKFFMRFTNAIIIANEAHPKELNGIPNHNVVEVYNSPPDLLEEIDTQINTDFVLFFAGVLRSQRPMNLDKVYQAIKNVDGAKLIIAGYGNHVVEIQKMAKNDPDKVEFIGKIGYREVLERTKRSAVILALYDPIVPTVRYAGGNKLFEAMMVGKPIVVSKGTMMAEIVERENCGLVIDCNNVDGIRKSILMLKGNIELCHQLGCNGRKAYEQKYSWRIMEHRMISLYHHISQITEGKNK